MWGTLMRKRVLYPPPQAVPLLPHGRRLGVVRACGFIAWVELFLEYLGLCVVVMLIYNIDNIHEGDEVNVKA